MKPTKKNAMAAFLARAARLAGPVLAVAAFIASVGFTDHRREDTACSGIRILVHDSLGMAFVNRNDVLQMVQDKIGQPVGKPLASINMAMLENILNNDAFVARAEVFSSVDGMLTVEVTQRNPVLRVINQSGESFYIDDQGEFMPLSEKYTADVAVASGQIMNTAADKRIRVFTPEQAEDTSVRLTTLEKVFAVNGFIRQHDFWSNQVEQLYVNEDQDIELVPRVGNHIIVFGDEKHMTEKFDKLFRFYREGLNRAGWNTYRTLNVKYRDQVVCTKK
jgi:cell division protein FtsQ